MKIRQIVKNVSHACLLLFVYFLPVIHNKYLAWYNMRKDKEGSFGLGKTSLGSDTES